MACRTGMRLRCILWTVIACVCAGPAFAQQQITPDAFLDLATGQTLTFSDYDTGITVGVEQFLKRDQSVWAQSDGRCSYGRIDIRGPLLCFIYENFPNPDNCWMPFQRDTEILVMSAESREIQRVTEITTDPVLCEGTPLS